MIDPEVSAGPGEDVVVGQCRLGAENNISSIGSISPVRKLILTQVFFETPSSDIEV